MIDNIKNSVTDIFSNASNFVTTTVDQLNWEKVIPQELIDRWNAFTTKAFIILIIAIIVLVLVNTVFDSVRRVIRGLDVAAIGGLFLWLSVKIPDIILIRNLKEPFRDLGIVIVVVGVILFIIFKLPKFLSKKGKQRNEELSNESGKTVSLQRTNRIVAVIISLVIGIAAGVAIDHFVLGKDNAANLDSVTVKETITEISELATLQNEYTETQDYKGDARKIFGKDIPFTSKSMQLVFSGVIKAGPNMDKAKITVNEKSGAINVILPHSTILSHEIDEDSIQLVGIKNGVFNRITPQDTNTVRKMGKTSKEKKVLQTDFLTRADEKAYDQILESLTLAYPSATVNISFK